MTDPLAIPASLQKNDPSYIQDADIIAYVQECLATDKKPYLKTTAGVPQVYYTRLVTDPNLLQQVIELVVNHPTANILDFIDLSNNPVVEALVSNFQNLYTANHLDQCTAIYQKFINDPQIVNKDEVRRLLNHKLTNDAAKSFVNIVHFTQPGMLSPDKKIPHDIKNLPNAPKTTSIFLAEIVAQNRLYELYNEPKADLIAALNKMIDSNDVNTNRPEFQNQLIANIFSYATATGDNIIGDFIGTGGKLAGYFSAATPDTKVEIAQQIIANKAAQVLDAAAFKQWIDRVCIANFPEMKDLLRDDQELQVASLAACLAKNPAYLQDFYVRFAADGATEEQKAEKMLEVAQSYSKHGGDLVDTAFIIYDQLDGTVPAVTGAVDHKQKWLETIGNKLGLNEVTISLYDKITDVAHQQVLMNQAAESCPDQATAVTQLEDLIAKQSPEIIGAYSTGIAAGRTNPFVFTQTEKAQVIQAIEANLDKPGLDLGFIATIEAQDYVEYLNNRASKTLADYQKDAALVDKIKASTAPLPGDFTAATAGNPYLTHVADIVNDVGNALKANSAAILGSDKLAGLAIVTALTKTPPVKLTYDHITEGGIEPACRLFDEMGKPEQKIQFLVNCYQNDLTSSKTRVQETIGATGVRIEEVQAHILAHKITTASQFSDIRNYINSNQIIVRKLVEHDADARAIVIKAIFEANHAHVFSSWLMNNFAQGFKKDPALIAEAMHQAGIDSNHANFGYLATHLGTDVSDAVTARLQTLNSKGVKPYPTTPAPTPPSQSSISDVEYKKYKAELKNTLFGRGGNFTQGVFGDVSYQNVMRSFERNPAQANHINYSKLAKLLKSGHIEALRMLSQYGKRNQDAPADFTHVLLHHLNTSDKIPADQRLTMGDIQLLAESLKKANPNFHDLDSWTKSHGYKTTYGTNPMGRKTDEDLFLTMAKLLPGDQELQLGAVNFIIKQIPKCKDEGEIQQLIKNNQEVLTRFFQEKMKQGHREYATKYLLHFADYTPLGTTGYVLSRKAEPRRKTIEVLLNNIGLKPTDLQDIADDLDKVKLYRDRNAKALSEIINDGIANSTFAGPQASTTPSVPAGTVAPPSGAMNSVAPEKQGEVCDHAKSVLEQEGKQEAANCVAAIQNGDDPSRAFPPEVQRDACNQIIESAKAKGALVKSTDTAEGSELKGKNGAVIKFKKENGKLVLDTANSRFSDPNAQFVITDKHGASVIVQNGQITSSAPGRNGESELFIPPAAASNLLAAGLGGGGMGGGL